MSARHVLALTGGIGSGKSTASAHFGRLGAIVVDVDRIGREVAEVGGPAHAALVARFGPSIVRDGALDRAALASQVFGHPDALADLNAISHPAINRVLAAEVERAGPDDIVLFDQAVLVESAILGRWADGGGSSLELRDARADNRLADNWGDSDESTKAPWTELSVTMLHDYRMPNPTSGTAHNAANRIEFFLQGAGEVLVDDLSKFTNIGLELLLGQMRNLVGHFSPMASHDRRKSSRRFVREGFGRFLQGVACGHGQRRAEIRD